MGEATFGKLCARVAKRRRVPAERHAGIREADRRTPKKLLVDGRDVFESVCAEKKSREEE